ncbi:hypothetical protein C802_02876 [Phocaeicola sartorii]|uniref:Uncharacterized protein n=1 Tax=Phocaeicola sartorii TaxID=671267 RepID=R9I662_9BACT|nr:hypothetical protein C802_02876 [Phocaeicola sartorii]
MWKNWHKGWIWLLVKILGKFGVLPSEIGCKQAKASAFDAP